MKRVLISQNESNNGADYLIVDGKLLNDQDSVVEFGRKISQTDDWKEIYNDSFLEIREDGKHLLIKSYYNEKDVVSRAIYYLYLVDEQDDFEVILNYLEKDSRLIEKTIDRAKTEELIEHLKNNRKVKKKVIKYLLITLGVALITYLLTKI